MNCGLPVGIQADQATPAHQGVLRHDAEWRADPAVDRALGPPAVAIVRKRLRLEYDCYTILQILSVHPFERAPLAQLLSRGGYRAADLALRNQVQLFDL